MKTLGGVLASAVLAPAVAGAKTKQVPYGKTKAHHANCAKHKAKGHNQ